MGALLSLEQRIRVTSTKQPIENRIRTGLTKFFDNEFEADVFAHKTRSYVYPCFEEVKTRTNGHTKTEFKHVGYCVPK